MVKDGGVYVLDDETGKIRNVETKSKPRGELRAVK